MKSLRTAVLCTCIMLSGYCMFAQTGSVPLNEPNPNKPKLFSSLPDNIPVNITGFDYLFELEAGSDVILPVSSAFRIQGQIVSTASKYENSIRSIVVRSSNYNGARVTISKLSNEDGTIRYTGRIVSVEHGDLYELQNKNGQYSFVKRNFYELMNE
jgi:hypothetical protein